MSKVKSICYGIFNYDFLKMEQKEQIFAFKSFSANEIKEMNVTKAELAKEMGLVEDGNFDYALPQGWLDKFVDNYCPAGMLRTRYYDLVRSTTFTLYVGGNVYYISGCIAIQEEINKESSYPTIGILSEGEI